MIVCVCNNVSDREISQAVKFGVATMEELQRDLGVAACCGQCHSCAKQVLASALEKESTHAQVPAPMLQNNQRHRTIVLMPA